MNRIEKTGRTVDDAVQAALKELGVSREDVLIEVPGRRQGCPFLDSSSGTPRYGLL